MGVLPSLLKSELDKKIYRVYVCESLRLDGKNQYLTAKYTDIIERKKEDTRDKHEILADLVQRAGLVITDEPI